MKGDLQHLEKSCIYCGKVYKKGHRSLKWFEQSKYCSQKCNGTVNRERLRSFRYCPIGNHTPHLTRRGVPRPGIGAGFGPDNHNWKGGSSKEYRSAYGQSKHRTWRMLVFVRDNYTCQRCWSRGYLTAHHIKSFSKFPKLRYIVSNGITLCGPCHAAVDPYYRRFHWRRLSTCLA
jgi:hypothetical protein